jgi:hypothetical protein
MLPMILLMIYMGIFAQTFLPSIGVANNQILTQTRDSIEQRVQTQTPEVANAR